MPACHVLSLSVLRARVPLLVEDRAVRLRIEHVAHTSPAVVIGVREDGVLVYLAVVDDKRPRTAVAEHVRLWQRLGHEVEERPRACARVRRQVEEYLRADRRAFDLELEPAGTPFQQAVWRQVQGVRYGKTITYGELARRCGQATALRAVARANALNPIALVIPCHRVVSTKGEAGTAWKTALLALERATPG